jgi:PAS domain-containing protein
VIFLLVDTDGRIVRFNDTTEELFGIADDESVRGSCGGRSSFRRTHSPVRGLLPRMNAGATSSRSEPSGWPRRQAARDPATVARVATATGTALADLRPGSDRARRPARGAEAQRDFLAVVARATPSLLDRRRARRDVALEGVNYAFRELTGYTDEEAIGAVLGSRRAAGAEQGGSAGVRGAGRRPA